jgi:eukaryotic-like serine/threonine-protein kinase
MPLEQLGPYKIEGILGRGGMGAVYAGVNEEAGTRAALKILSPTLADDAGFRERFKAEIETLKKLRHPNIVQLYGYGEHDGHLFYAMELVEGRNLQDELQSGRKFDWREVCRIGIAICQGLKHAHDVGVIHRDLKPANLLITPDGVIKLSDFGIAKLYGISHLTADGGVLGTADYMAPEQADGRPVTTRCDLYSLGSVLYALLARRPPFAAASLPEVLHALKYDEAPPVRRFAPQTPRELESILAELLRKDPQQRIATPLVLSNRLKAMLHALPEEEEAEEDEFELRMEEPSPTPLSQQTTLGSSQVRPHPEDVSFAPTPTRAMTAALPPPSAAATAPSTRHFTVVEDQKSAGREGLPPIDDGTPWWAAVAAALLLISVVGGLGWYLTRPATADALYARIEAVAAEDDPAAFANVEAQISEFLSSHSGDPRYETVRAYEQELHLHRLQRRLDSPLRSLRVKETKSPVEQALLESIAWERTSPEKAVARLEAIIQVYGSDTSATPTQQHYVELARRELAALRERVTRGHEEHRQILAARLAEARRLADDDPQQAAAICHGMVTLYGDKPWAENIIGDARELLQILPGPAPEDP